MKTIKTHKLDGVFDQKSKINAREKFEVLIEDMIREVGQVPVLDMSTQWFTSWNEEEEHYECTVVMFGVYVGKRKAKESIIGWEQESGRLIYV